MGNKSFEKSPEQFAQEFVNSLDTLQKEKSTMPENSINFKLKKNKYNDIINQIAEQLASSKVNRIKEVEEAFLKKLDDLKNTPMDGNMFLAFFCKFFHISKKGIERIS